jgi:hypothetical protein
MGEMLRTISCCIVRGGCEANRLQTANALTRLNASITAPVSG